MNEETWHANPYGKGICACTNGNHFLIKDTVAINAMPRRDEIISDHQQAQQLEQVYDILETRVAVIDTLIDWKSSHLSYEASRLTYLAEHEKFAQQAQQVAALKAALEAYLTYHDEEHILPSNY